MRNIKYIPIRALSEGSEGCITRTDSAGNEYCLTNAAGFDNTDTSPDNPYNRGGNMDESGEGGNDLDLDGEIDQGGNGDWNDPNSPDHDQMSEALGGEETDNTFRENMEAQQERNNQFAPSDITDIPPYTSESDNWEMRGQDRQYGDEGSWNSDAPYNDFSGSGGGGGKGYTDFSV